MRLVGLARFALAACDLLLDLLGLDRNERLAVRLGQRVGLGILGADQLGVGDGRAGFDVLEFAIGGEGVVFGDDGGIVGNLSGDLVGKGCVGIAWHRVRGGLVGNALNLQ